MESEPKEVNARVLGVEVLNEAPARDVLVVVPTYNERENIADFIEAVAAEGCDLLFVDDASPDGTADVIRAKAVTTRTRVTLMRRRGKLGLGTAYMDAYRWILSAPPDGRVVVQMDADFSHEPSRIVRLAEAAAASGVAVGSRYVQGGKMPGWPLRRRLLSHGANLYAETILRARHGGYALHDSTAGFVAWRRDALQAVFAEPVMSNGYAFQIETKFRASRCGFRPVELPITFPDRSRGVSKIDRSIIFEALLLPWKLDGKRKGSPTACPLCGDRPSFFTEKDGYDFWKSQDCGLLFVWPFLEKPPAQIYQAGYFNGAADGFGYVDYDQEKKTLEGLFGKILLRLEALAPRKGALLDVGAATGHFVGMAKAAGWDARGIDVSEAGAAAAKAKGLRVDATTLDAFDAAPESFEALTMWDVIEHLPDPFGALDRCHRLLQPGGVLAIITPDGGSLWARLLGKRWHSLIPPEHIFIFGRSALRLALEKAGFDVVEAQNPVKSFTLPYVVSTFARWTGIAALAKAAEALRSTPFAKLAFPIPLRDNLLVLAKKKGGWPGQA